jgi:hypothetical protein
MYCEVEPDTLANNTKLIFHRGGKDGPILGTADSCPQHPDQTDIHVVSPNIVIPFRHKDHPLFEHKGKGYSWKKLFGHHSNELVEDGTGETTATFEPNVFEGNREMIHDVGKVVTKQDTRDIVVMSVILAQVREEEMMGPVCLYIKVSLMVASKALDIC